MLTSQIYLILAQPPLKVACYRRLRQEEGIRRSSCDTTASSSPSFVVLDVPAPVLSPVRHLTYSRLSCLHSLSLRHPRRPHQGGRLLTYQDPPNHSRPLRSFYQQF